MARGIFGIDFSKVPWTPLIVGGVVIYGLSKLKEIIPANPWATPDDVAEAATSEVWSGTYGIGKNAHWLTAADANRVAQNIYNAYGAFTNDFSGIIAQFKLLKYKTWLTSVINAFNNLYGEDLYTYITGGIKNASLASKQMQAIVISYVNSLPSGIES